MNTNASVRAVEGWRAEPFLDLAHLVRVEGRRPSTMSTNAIILIVVLILLFGGGGYYWRGRR